MLPRNGAKLIYIHPLWFYQKSSTDPSKGELRESHGKKPRSLIGQKRQNSFQ